MKQLILIFCLAAFLPGFGFCNFEERLSAVRQPDFLQEEDYDVEEEALLAATLFPQLHSLLDEMIRERLSELLIMITCPKCKRQFLSGSYHKCQG